MTIAAKLREVLRQAELYEKRQEAAGYPDNTDYSKMPEYKAKLEALLPVIRKELPLKAHVHRADVAARFGLRRVDGFLHRHAQAGLVQKSAFF